MEKHFIIPQIIAEYDEMQWRPIGYLKKILNQDTYNKNNGVIARSNLFKGRFQNRISQTINRDAGNGFDG